MCCNHFFQKNTDTFNSFRVLEIHMTKNIFWQELSHQHLSSNAEFPLKVLNQELRPTFSQIKLTTFKEVSKSYYRIASFVALSVITFQKLLHFFGHYLLTFLFVFHYFCNKKNRRAQASCACRSCAQFYFIKSPERAAHNQEFLAGF